MYSIYLIMHNDSGRVYIGQTQMPVDFRLQIHYRPSNGCVHLRNAVQKYGREAFTCYELARDLSKEQADELEIALIREHDSTRTGFNISTGGQASWHTDMCRSGHDLRLVGARDSLGRCKVCHKRNKRAHYARVRNDPDAWAQRLERSRNYKREWRARKHAA